MRILHLALTTVALGACGPGPQANDSGTGTVPTACADGVPPDLYVAGIERLTPFGQAVRITDAVPAPPDVGINTFVVQTPGSTPASVRLRPWMPLHGHGTDTEWFTGATGPDGFTFTGVDLYMPGLWELRFTLDSEVPEDGALFRFCLEG